MPMLLFKIVAYIDGQISGGEREITWYIPLRAPTVRADLTIFDGACWLLCFAAVESMSQCKGNEGEDKARVSLC